MNKQRYLPVCWLKQPLAQVHAFTTLINGGVSRGDFLGFNLATHVGDDEHSVKQNRIKLTTEAQLPAEPVWLDQIHSHIVIDAAKHCGTGQIEKADASYANKPGVVCTVLTADCLPVFFCNIDGTEVAVAHAGWRGLHAGILSETLKAMKSPVEEILINFGPAIGPASFEVGEDVYQAFTDKHTMYQVAFEATTYGHYHCDIYRLAALELQELGIVWFSGGGYCTYIEKQRFYSFRRQPRTGRMASLIWMA